MIKSRSGFSIVELLIYIAIVGLLASVAIPGFIRIYERSKISATKTTLANLKQAITTYYLDTNKYPNMLEDLIERPQNIKSWSGPYLEREELPEDGWGNPFYYSPTPGQKHPYELYSYGATGPEGGNEDQISVWEK